MTWKAGGGGQSQRVNSLPVSLYSGKNVPAQKGKIGAGIRPKTYTFMLIQYVPNYMESYEICSVYGSKLVQQMQEVNPPTHLHTHTCKHTNTQRLPCLICCQQELSASHQSCVFIIEVGRTLDARDDVMWCELIIRRHLLDTHIWHTHTHTHLSLWEEFESSYLTFS